MNISCTWHVEHLHAEQILGPFSTQSLVYLCVARAGGNLSRSVIRAYFNLVLSCSYLQSYLPHRTKRESTRWMLRSSCSMSTKLYLCAESLRGYLLKNSDGRCGAVLDMGRATFSEVEYCARFLDVCCWYSRPGQGDRKW